MKVRYLELRPEVHLVQQDGTIRLLRHGAPGIVKILRGRLDTPVTLAVGLPRRIIRLKVRPRRIQQRFRPVKELRSQPLLLGVILRQPRTPPLRIQ